MVFWEKRYDFSSGGYNTMLILWVSFVYKKKLLYFYSGILIVKLCGNLTSIKPHFHLKFIFEEKTTKKSSAEEKIEFDLYPLQSTLHLMHKSTCLSTIYIFYRIVLISCPPQWSIYLFCISSFHFFDS